MVLILLAVGCQAGRGDLVLVGTVERTMVELAAPVGETLIEVSVQRGERVSAGQLVARLDPTLARADLAGAEATLVGARAVMFTNERDVERFTGLRRNRIVAAETALDLAPRFRSLRKPTTKIPISRWNAARVTDLAAPAPGTARA